MKKFHDLMAGNNDEQSDSLVMDKDQENYYEEYNK